MAEKRGGKVEKAAFYGLCKCCLFSCNKPVNLEVANEIGESQGSLLNSVPALVQFYHWLNKAWVSVMCASSVQT